MRPSNVAHRGSGQSHAVESGSFRPLVLIVDADWSARSVLEVALTREGFDVWSSGTGAEALELVALGGRTPDVVVAATAERRDDGYAFCAQVRGIKMMREVPLLLLSRADEAGEQALAEVVGVDRVLRKPAFARDVASLIRVELQHKAQGGVVTFSAESLPPATLLRAMLSASVEGRLSLVGGSAEVAFREGKIFDASFDGKRGIDPMVRALVLTRGPYTLKLEPVAGLPEVHCTLRDLVHTVGPRLSRFHKAVLRGVPLDAQLQLDFRRLGATLKAMPDEVNRVVRLFDGFRRVRDVLVDSELDETTTLEVATRLYLMGVVQPVASSPDELLLPKPQPRLFEPRPVEAEETMRNLFEGTAEVRAAQAPEAELDDWVQDVLGGSGLDVPEPDAGWTAAPLAQNEALTGDLPEALKQQLEAFNITAAVEPKEVPAAKKRVQAFAAGTGDDEVASLTHALNQALADLPEEEAVAAAVQAPVVVEAAPRIDPQERIVTPLLTPVVEAAPEPLQLTQAVEPAPLPQADSLEASFFGQALELELEPPLPKPAAPVAKSPAAEHAIEELDKEVETSLSALNDVELVRPPRRLAIGVAIALVVLGLAVVAEWLFTTPQPPPAVTQAAPVVAPAEVAVAVPLPQPAAIEDVEPPEFVNVDDADVTKQLDEARALYESGKYDAAVVALEKLVTEQDSNAQAWLLLGLARYDAGDEQGAQDAVNQVMALDAANARAHLLNASLHFDANRKAEAKASLEKYLELDPNGPFAAEAKSLLAR